MKNTPTQANDALIQLLKQVLECKYIVLDYVLVDFYSFLSFTQQRLVDYTIHCFFIGGLF